MFRSFADNATTTTHFLTLVETVKLRTDFVWNLSAELKDEIA